RTERIRRLVAAKDHVAVQVLSIRHGTPLIGDEGRKGTRPVVAIRSFDFPLPRRLRQCLRVLDTLQQFAAGELAAGYRVPERLDGVGLECLSRFALGKIAV